MDKLEQASQIGFDAVALPGRYLTEYLGELRKCFKYSPLPFSSLSLGFEGSLLSPNPELRRCCRKSLIELFKICAEFSIPVLTVPPVLIMDNLERYHESEIQDKLLLDQLPALADTAKYYGVIICLEPVNRYESDYMNTVADALKICKILNNPTVAVNIDLFHMQIEEINSEKAILDAGKWIGNVHISDNTRVQPGVGSMKFSYIFSALRQIGYSGYIEIEARKLTESNAHVLYESCKYVRSIIMQVC